jgi:hypothetical protein
MAKFDISYTDKTGNDRVKRGLKLSKENAKKEISKMKSSKIFRGLFGGKLSNPRIYRRK